MVLLDKQRTLLREAEEKREAAKQKRAKEKVDKWMKGITTV
jgi:hypothetical protein